MDIIPTLTLVDQIALSTPVIIIGVTALIKKMNLVIDANLPLVAIIIGAISNPFISGIAFVESTQQEMFTSVMTGILYGMVASGLVYLGKDTFKTPVKSKK